MKNRYQFPHSIFFFLLLAATVVVLYTGCEKVIDVELNESDPVIVIEGNLSFETSALEVKITRTGNYFSVDDPVTVDGAAVCLQEEYGVMHEAEEAGEGIYRLSQLNLKPGTTYVLHVEAEEREYVAASTLNPPVKIDSLQYEYTGDTRFFDSGYRLLVYFADPMGRSNYYRIKVYRNGELLNSLDDLIIFEDDDLDGRIIQVRLRQQIFSTGDTARVDLLSLDRNAWLYYSTLREMANPNPGSPAPSNPISNFNNGALGCFSAWSGSSMTTYIGEKKK